MKTIQVNGKYQTQVSDCDYEYLSQWRWSYKRSRKTHNGLIYVKRSKNIFKNGIRIKCKCIFLHHVVLELKGEQRPSKKHDADHIDTDTFNNTRDNLRWRTRLKNRGHHP